MAYRRFLCWPKEGRLGPPLTPLFFEALCGSTFYVIKIRILRSGSHFPPGVASLDFFWKING